MTSQNRSAGARIYNATDDLELCRLIQEKKDSLDVLNFTGFQIDNITTAGAKEYKLQYWKARPGGGNTVSIRNACFLLFKIS